ncbi:MAG TPA: PAS domain S-box protein [Coleofasciculaceae cyanobacterium]|jgi:PAS domain S-box-containing protein
MPEFFKTFLTSEGFIPHGHCYLWKPDLVWLHVVSDCLIGLAYYSIPLMLVYFVRSRRDVPFDWIFWMFGTFIIACGTTHLLEVWTLWHPVYWLSGFIKAITALASLGTAVLLALLIPKALALPSPAQLEVANLALRNEIAHRQEAEEALHRREQEFKALVENAPDVIARYDRQRRNLYVNPAIEWESGVPPHAFLGKTVSEIGYPEEFAQRWEAWFQDVFLTGETRWEEFNYFTPKGLKFYQVRIVPEFATDSSVESILTIARDITQIKQAEEALQRANQELETRVEERTSELVKINESLQTEIESRKRIEAALQASEQRFRAIFNQAAVGIAQVGIDGQWLLINQKLCDIIGYTQQELLERRFQDITYLDDLDSDLEQVHRMLAGEIQTYSIEKRYIHKVGFYVWINLTGSIVRNFFGEPEYFIAIVEDISDRKQIAEEIRLLQTIIQAISEAADFDAALEVALCNVCEATGWDFGEAWIPHPHQQTLKLSSAWYSNTESLNKFRRNSEELTLALDAGIPGRVWASKRPEWIQDVSLQPESVFLRNQMALEVGLTAALGVPIIADVSEATSQASQVLAVFIFFRFESCQEDKRLVELVSSIANQLGLVIQRKYAEEALQKSYNLLQSVIEGTPDAVFVKDLHGRYMMLNSAVASVQGRSKSEILGRDDLELFGHETALPIMENDRRIMTTGKTEILEEAVLIGDTLQTYLSTKSVWRDAQGNVIGLIVIARDITDRKRAEQQIRELNENLERRVVERTAELAAANKELEAFSYSVSHDLRAPLRGIDGFSRTLLERYGDKLDEKGKHYLQRIRAGTQRMGELIDDLLKLSRVTRSEMRRTQVDLSTMAQHIAMELQRTQPERQVEWAIAPGLVADGDAQLLRVALENLINNAWKFTSSKVKSRIEFNVILKGDAKLAFFVHDNGAGFDMAYANKLFKAFQRLHSTTEFPGTGIGLATVQRIIHRHGGRVWAEGAVEQGATFYFTL